MQHGDHPSVSIGGLFDYSYESKTGSLHRDVHSPRHIRAALYRASDSEDMGIADMIMHGRLKKDAQSEDNH